MNRSLGLAAGLALVPLLGVTVSWRQAGVFCMLSLLIVTVYGLSMQPVRQRLSGQRRTIASVSLAATWISCGYLAAQVLVLELAAELSAYLLLLGVQCVLLDRGGFFQAGHGKRRLRLFALFSLLLLAMTLLRGLLANHFATFAPGGFILLGSLLAGWRAWAQRSTPTD